MRWISLLAILAVGCGGEALALPGGAGESLPEAGGAPAEGGAAEAGGAPAEDAPAGPVCPAPGAWGCRDSGGGPAPYCCQPLDWAAGRCGAPARCGAPVTLPDFEGGPCVPGCGPTGDASFIGVCCTRADYESGECFPPGAWC